MNVRNTVAAIPVIICLFLISPSGSASFAIANDAPSLSVARSLSRPSLLVNRMQLGSEYDDNVFKVYGDGRSDGLMRMLFNSRFRRSSLAHTVGGEVTMGGKKYFSTSAQDAALAAFLANWQYRPLSTLRFDLSAEAKGQIENQDLDPDGIDLNEDYVQLRGRFGFSHPLGNTFRNTMFASYRFYDFYGGLNISFREQTFGTRINRPLSKRLTSEAHYSLRLTQFPQINGRSDVEHRAGALLRFGGPMLFSLGYAYETNRSSLEAFSSEAHIVTTLLSIAIDPFSRGEADMTVSLLGRLQLRHYPDIFVSDVEGQRLLIIDGEENNFNSVTVKVTKRLNQTLTLEAKYTHQGNDLSDRQSRFSRNRMMLGLRALF